MLSRCARGGTQLDAEMALSLFIFSSIYIYISSIYIYIYISHLFSVSNFVCPQVQGQKWDQVLEIVSKSVAEASPLIVGVSGQGMFADPVQVIFWIDVRFARNAAETWGIIW